MAKDKCDDKTRCLICTKCGRCIVCGECDKYGCGRDVEMCGDYIS